MKRTDIYWQVFNQAIDDYHQTDSVDQPIYNPFDSAVIERLLYQKCWIDTVQWHLEDIIRNPDLEPIKAVAIKRRIDISNQERTDIVENIDIYFLKIFEHVKPLPDAQINTESPAWAIDRLSILALKIYHMQEQTERSGISDVHRANCMQKLAKLQEQRDDLCTAIEQLLSDIEAGKKYMKVYRQMKMYNDPNLNPCLYNKKN